MGRGGGKVLVKSSCGAPIRSGAQPQRLLTNVLGGNEGQNVTGLQLWAGGAPQGILTTVLAGGAGRRKMEVKTSPGFSFGRGRAPQGVLTTVLLCGRGPGENGGRNISGPQLWAGASAARGFDHGFCLGRGAEKRRAQIVSWLDWGKQQNNYFQ